MSDRSCLWCGQYLPNRLIADLAGVSPSSVDRYYRLESIDSGVRRRIEVTIAALTSAGAIVPPTLRRVATSRDPVRGSAIADAPARQAAAGREAR